MEKEQVALALHEMLPVVIRAARKHLGISRIEPIEESIKSRIFNIFDKQELKELLQHCCFCLFEAEVFLEQGKVDKAMRWLCWVQGNMHALGVMSIYQGQKQNQPH